ncbi:CPBP family intramembrane glutamic endopeptidase [Pasteuria penetrans]|uniref:CPBP family intramembrane glutamic endopeptidase n=1 Tax=Pasteuria penetrans TaxID=86005 RepID=UPI001FE45C5D|nr:CPBP family intramembrane glutamic endopeptidase [Pasteuria penetrans]
MVSSLLSLFFTLCMVWTLMKFDQSYYRHIVVLENSSRRGAFQNWGRVANVLLPLASLYFLIFNNIYLVGTMDPTFKAKLKGGLLGALFSLPESVPEWLVFSGFLLSPFLLCLFWIWPTFRSFIVSGLGLDPQRYAHRCMVCWVFSLFIVTVFVWVFLNPPNLMEHIGKGSSSSLIGTLLINILLMNGVLALLVVGWGTGRRSWRGIWERLGLNKRPTWKGFFLVCLLIVANFIVEGLVVGLIGDDFFHIPPPAPVVPPLAWVTVPLLGICPGVGEELLFRGALQPRVGILVSSVAFSLFHFANGYSWFEFLFLFMGSLLLGWVARRYSLWLSMWGHALYNVMVFSWTFLIAM